MFDARLLAFLKRLSPHSLYQKLDPFEASIEAFVREAAAEIKPGKRVLDAGDCRFKQLFAHAEYVGLDLERGEVIAQLDELPFPDASFDHVFSIAVLAHTPQPSRVIEEFQRVLKPGGMVHLAVTCLQDDDDRQRDYFQFTSSGIRYLLQSSGIRIRKIHPVGGYFWQIARNLMAVPAYAQSGWRWLLFPVLVPVFGLLVPLCCYYLDSLDQERSSTLGYVAEGWKQ